MTANWVEVFDAVKAVGGNPVDAIVRAWQFGVSAEEVLAAVERARHFEGFRDFDDWEGVPPGCIDTRVFTQGTWWVDVLRRPHLIAEMSEEYVANVIGFLWGDVDYYYDRFRFGHPMIEAASPEQWLEATPLMTALKIAAGR